MSEDTTSIPGSAAPSIGPTSVRADYHQQLLEAHSELQTVICKWVLPIALIVFLGTALVDVHIWQHWVLLAGFCAMGVSWLHARRLTIHHRRLTASLLWFGGSVLSFETIALTLIEGNSASALLACLIIVIYASLFTNRYMIIFAAITLIAYLFASVANATDLIPQVKLVGLNQLMFDGVFMLLLLPVAAFILHWNFRIKNNMMDRMQEMNTRQREIIGAAREVGTVISVVAESLDEFALNLSAQVTEQASSIAETGSIFQQISSIASRTSDAARKTREAALQTRQKSVTTIQRIHNVKHSFNRVIGANEDAKLVFGELAAQAESIDQVLRLNRDVAAQIKILAVNAGIQAAKAGEFGVGFNVVAKELKSMIARTDKSLEDSRLLLESIRLKARQSAESIEANSMLLQEHYEELGTTSALVEEISSGFKSSTDQFDGIANGAEEQKAGLTQIDTGIAQISVAANDLSAKVHTLLSSVQQLLDSQRMLQRVLSEKISET